MKRLNHRHALTLFSGGQDSSIALAWALERYDAVSTVGFDYGQRHNVELETRLRVRAEIEALNPAWSARLKDDVLVDVRGLGALSETSLTRETAIETADTGLPTTFVPGRNLIFLGFAAALAYRIDAGVLVAGMCEEDEAGYPDCRAEALDRQMAALCAGLDADFALETPVLRIPKSKSWELAEAIGGTTLVDVILEHSHTCYLGERGTRHGWGYGCGECPACTLRAKGWRAYVEERSQGNGQGGGA
ncbi:MAG: 7-cyano-7-deazaguanine synthase QueC [Pseudomonadota bacterium]